MAEAVLPSFQFTFCNGLSLLMRRMKQRVPDILVATPGRLVDLLENEGLDVMLRSIKVLIFDEADQCEHSQQPHFEVVL